MSTPCLSVKPSEVVVALAARVVLQLVSTSTNCQTPARAWQRPSSRAKPTPTSFAGIGHFHHSHHFHRASGVCAWLLPRSPPPPPGPPKLSVAKLANFGDRQRVAGAKEQILLVPRHARIGITVRPYSRCTLFRTSTRCLLTGPFLSLSVEIGAAQWPASGSVLAGLVATVTATVRIDGQRAVGSGRHGPLIPGRHDLPVSVPWRLPTGNVLHPARLRARVAGPFPRHCPPVERGGRLASAYPNQKQSYPRQTWTRECRAGNSVTDLMTTTGMLASTIKQSIASVVQLAGGASPQPNIVSQQEPQRPAGTRRLMS